MLLVMAPSAFKRLFTVVQVSNMLQKLSSLGLKMLVLPSPP